MQNGSLFRWICLAVAVLFAGTGIWLVNDVRVTVKDRTEKLPELIDNSRQATATLKELSQDMKDLRTLAGAASGTRDATFVRYATDVLKLIEEEGKDSVVYPGQRDGTSGKILKFAEKVTGSDKTKTPVQEWVNGARKEALYLVLVCKSKKEILERLCRNNLGEPFLIESKDGQNQQPLQDWVNERLPANQDQKEPQHE